MTWARHSGSSSAHDEDSRMGVLRAEEAERLAAEHCRALVTVAGHSASARECTELLDMLGLDAGLWRER